MSDIKQLTYDELKSIQILRDEQIWYSYLTYTGSWSNPRVSGPQTCTMIGNANAALVNDMNELAEAIRLEYRILVPYYGQTSP